MARTKQEIIRQIQGLNKANRVRFDVSFSKSKDEDVIAKLSSVENKTDYIRKLIRNDICKA